MRGVGVTVAAVALAKAVKKNKCAEVWIYSTARKSHQSPALFYRCDLFFFSRNRPAELWRGHLLYQTKGGKKL
jgi:hypothetical protein